MLEIMGESMIEAGILDGDYVIVRQQQTAKNGDIVVAMTEDDEATGKRFFKEKDFIRLQPENSTMDPIILKKCFHTWKSNWVLSSNSLILFASAVATLFLAFFNYVIFILIVICINLVSVLKASCGSLDCLNTDLIRFPTIYRKLP